MRPLNPPAPRKVLIVKPSSLGDVIGGIPVLRGLRRTFPQAHIAWLVTPACADVLSAEADLDEVILFNRRRFGRMARSPAAARDFAAFCLRLRRERFDWVIDLQGLFRSGFLSFASGAPVRAGPAEAREVAAAFYTHRVRTVGPHTVDRNVQLARALGVDARGEDLTLTSAPPARRSAAALVDGHGIRPGRFVLTAPGTRWANKLYPVRLWRRVLAELAADMPVVVVGASGEVALCAEVAQGLPNVLDLGGRTSLAELVALASLAGAVVCCDSAANFIAPAVGTPSVVLMGPTRPERTGPYRGRGLVLRADIACLGCLLRRCPHATCMQWISPAAVVAAVRRVLARPGPPGGTAAPAGA